MTMDSSGSDIPRVQAASDRGIRCPANDASSVAKDRYVVTVYSKAQQEIVERNFTGRLQALGESGEIQRAHAGTRDLNGVSAAQRSRHLPACAAQKREL